MDVYKVSRFEDAVRGNAYPGRGIIAGLSSDGTKAAIAYFIMGRSANSRNRVFTERDGALFTEPFDASKVEDPSLIIYAAVREYENHLIVTNGDQTDTVYEGLAAGKSFYEALESRCFEPDAPNFTPRISAEVVFGGAAGSDACQDAGPAGTFMYRMSILKSADAAGSAGHGLQLAQAEGGHDIAQDVDILAHGGLGGTEQLAEVGEGKDAIGRIGKNLHHGAHALITADFLHRGSLLSLHPPIIAQVCE